MYTNMYLRNEEEKRRVSMPPNSRAATRGGGISLGTYPGGVPPWGGGVPGIHRIKSWPIPGKAFQGVPGYPPPDPGPTDRPNHPLGGGGIGLKAEG